MEFSIILTVEGTQLFPICCKCLSAGASPGDENCTVHQEALKFAVSLIEDGHVSGYLEPVEV